VLYIIIYAMGVHVYSYKTCVRVCLCVQLLDVYS
jgi:hypothetical protein